MFLKKKSIDLSEQKDLRTPGGGSGFGGYGYNYGHRKSHGNGDGSGTAYGTACGHGWYPSNYRGLIDRDEHRQG